MKLSHAENLTLARACRDAVVTALSTTNGPIPAGQLGRADDLKGESDADMVATRVVAECLRDRQADLRVLVEGHGCVVNSEDAETTWFVDPLDGSLNHALATGDSGFVVAWSDAKAPTFGDILGGFVFGLRSGDEYWSDGTTSYWRPSEKDVRPIGVDKSVVTLSDAFLYFNDGYGPDFFANAHRRCSDLLPRVKHRNAFDNAGLEIAQMCRGAAHLRVEARSSQRDGKWCGSEHANILAAFAIGQAAGLQVADLNGMSLSDTLIELDKVQDFVCASHPELLKQAIQSIKRGGSAG